MNEEAALKGLIRVRRRTIRELEPQVAELRRRVTELKREVIEARLNEEAARRVLRMAERMQAVQDMADCEIVTDA